MTQQEAKKQMRSIWLNLPEGKINGMDKYNSNFGLLFYSYIQNNFSDLLNFRYSGDKYQIVKAWLGNWQRFFNPHQ